MWIHGLFDLLAVALSALTAMAFKTWSGVKHPLHDDSEQLAWYLLTAILGVFVGAIGLGTWNLHLSGQEQWGKSILGGLLGAMVFIEVFKKIKDITGSTGMTFVPSLCVMIVVGRLGCHWAGVEDMTHGTETALPWAMDLGDGLKRHPVALYEAMSMAFFLAVFLITFQRHKRFWQVHGFLLFLAYYSTQRWVWEWLKPYQTIWAGMNLFQWCCLILLTWSLYLGYQQRDTQT